MACPVCSSVANSGVSLANGEIVHSNCFQKITDAVSIANQTLLAEQTRIATLRSQLASQESLFALVARFFGQGSDSEDLKSRIKETEDKIRMAESNCNAARAIASPIFDLMLNYPPDWIQRSTAVKARDKVCTNCGSSNMLQAHHVVPISKGGTNHLSNLKLLCERCHLRTHGTQAFSSTQSEAPPAIADRVQILGSAIASGIDVEFMYKKPTDASHKKRHVTPSALIEMEHERDEGKSLCLKGYCHLRKSERIFSLKRMQGVKYAKG